MDWFEFLRGFGFNIPDPVPPVVPEVHHKFAWKSEGYPPPVSNPGGMRYSCCWGELFLGTNTDPQDLSGLFFTLGSSFSIDRVADSHLTSGG